MLFYILAFNDIGSTFLDWSMHYLSGNDTFWSHKKNKWINLCKNPLTENNAHNHKPNLLRGLKEIDEFTSNIHNFYQEKGKLYSFRMHPLTEESTVDLMETTSYWNKFLPVVCKNYKLIYLFDSFEQKNLLPRGVKKDIEGLNLFFKKDRNILCKIRLLRLFGEEISTKIATNGKMRNFIFFNLKNISKNQPNDIENLKLANFFPVNYENLINSPETTIKKIHNFLNLKLEEKKLESWKKIYLEWKKLLKPKIIFTRDIDKICYHIKNKLSFDLEKYELDLFQEALIMEHFFKCYNRVLKVGCLDHFPNDTIELKNFF